MKFARIAITILLAAAMHLATVGVAAARDMVTGDAIVAKVDHATRVITIGGERFQVTQRTQLLDDQGHRLALSDIRPMDEVGPGEAPAVHTGDRVHYEGIQRPGRDAVHLLVRLQRIEVLPQ